MVTNDVNSSYHSNNSHVEYEYLNLLMNPKCRKNVEVDEQLCMELENLLKNREKTMSLLNKIDSDNKYKATNGMY